VTLDSISQQIWHVKEPSLLKAINAKHIYEFAALSRVMPDYNRKAEKLLTANKY
jgi:hypothetical protein